MIYGETGPLVVDGGGVVERTQLPRDSLPKSVIYSWKGRPPTVPSSPPTRLPLFAPLYSQMRLHRQMLGVL